MSVKDFTSGYLSSMIYRTEVGIPLKMDTEVDDPLRTNWKWKIVGLLDDNTNSVFFGAAFQEVDPSGEATDNIVISIRGIDNPYQVDIGNMKTWNNIIPFINEVIKSNFLGVAFGKGDVQLQLAVP
ncbi:hypothetical protein [Paenibacillus luteus]|uniref:hypothetical protein n=1 Tax=Paenibacillus luteus TaxID=2545753 RepID=UPI001144E63A|nr:hypothetical protein [Paenibacillus luteus]